MLAEIDSWQGEHPRPTLTEIEEAVDDQLRRLRQHIVEAQIRAHPRAGHVTRDDVPTCRLTDLVGDVRGRVQVSEWDSCIVVNEERVVLGRLRGEAFDGDPNRTAEAAMQIGPSTVRPNEPLDALTNRMREKGMASVIVTTSDGRLVGILRRDDSEKRLAEQKA